MGKMQSYWSLMVIIFSGETRQQASESSQTQTSESYWVLCGCFRRVDSRQLLTSSLPVSSLWGDASPWCLKTPRLGHGNLLPPSATVCSQRCLASVKPARWETQLYDQRRYSPRSFCLEYSLTFLSLDQCSAKFVHPRRTLICQRQVTAHRKTSPREKEVQNYTWPQLRIYIKVVVLWKCRHTKTVHNTCWINLAVMKQCLYCEF
jgi:hypothetical protein